MSDTSNNKDFDTAVTYLVAWLQSVLSLCTEEKTMQIKDSDKFTEFLHFSKRLLDLPQT